MHHYVKVFTWQPLIAFLLLLCLQTSASAAGFNQDVIPKSYSSFLLGLVGGIALHELGHVAVASAEGYRIRHDGLSITYSPPFASRSDRLRVSTAGLQTQWVTTEAAFHYREKAPDFTTGLIAAHLGITAAYLTVLKNNREGDVLSASRASGLSTDRILLLAMVPALLDGWRLLGTDIPSWVAPVSIGFKAGCMTAIWIY